MARREFTYLQVEAALCVWEHINDLTMDEAHGGVPEWITLREGVGSAELRSQSVELGIWCLEIYDLCTKDNQNFFEMLAYDWEVIPMIMRYARDENGPAIYRNSLRDPEVIAPLVMHEHGLNEFIGNAKYYARLQWAYEDLIDDHPDHVEKAFEDKENPREFVKWLGEKYDLSPNKVLF